MSVKESWGEIVRGGGRATLEARLREYLPSQRWFGGKARAIRAVRLRDAVRFGRGGWVAYLLILDVDDAAEGGARYALPVAFAPGEKAAAIRAKSPEAVLLSGEAAGDPAGVLYDAVRDEGFCRGLLEGFLQPQSYQGERGGASFFATSILAQRLAGASELPSPSVARTEQSNTSIFFEERLVLKLFRRLQPGINPDLEVGLFLTEKARFSHTPPVAGAIEYRAPDEESTALGILLGFVRNRGDAWKEALEHLAGYYDRALGRREQGESVPVLDRHLLDAAAEEPPPVARAVAGDYLPKATLLGKRTAELHRALASDEGDPDFAPEPFTDAYRNGQYEAMRGLATEVFRLLRGRMEHVPEAFQADARSVADLEDEVLSRFESIRGRRFEAMRIRTHGDYHLGQVLSTGDDFSIIDFEGEPARSLAERRSKGSALRDVAGMLRSYHYASFAGAFARAESSPAVSRAAIEPWRRLWYEAMSVSFLRGYLEAARGASFLPRDREELRIVLDAYVLEKAVYELGYELNNRPSWVGIPLQGVLQIVDPEVS